MGILVYQRLNSSKFGFYPGISEGRGSFGILMSRFPTTRWPYQGKGPLDERRGFAGVILALMQMWEPRWDAMCPEVIPGVSWTKITLAAWSRRFLPWRGPWRGATGAHRCSQPRWYPVFVMQCCDGNPCVLFSSVWPMYLF